MKKSTSIAGQHGYNLQSRNTFRSSTDKASGDTPMNQQIILRGQGHMKEENSGGVSTIGSLSIVTQEIIQLPPEVLRIILSNLTKEDLLQSRRVNSLWRASTSNILCGRNDEIVFNEFIESFPLLSTIVNCLTRAKELECLDQFPCTRFMFCHINLDDEDTQNFFGLYGPFIKTLKLNLCSSRVIKDGQLVTLDQLLTRQAPNIEELELDVFDIVLPTPDYDGQIRLFPPNNEVKLPALKKLSAYFICAKSNRIVEEILGTAVNLECYDVNSKYDKNILDKLVSLNKIHTIKRADVNLSHRLEFWDHFANLGPNLQSVEFHLDSLPENQHDFNLMKRITTAIQKILESSRHTLEKIHIQPLYFLPGLEIPVLSQLKELTVDNNSTNFIMGNVFSLGLSLATVFPNVQKVDITLRHHATSNADFWTTFFPHINLMDNKWPSVRSLKIRGVPPESIDNISRLFSNVKILSVVSVADISLSCRSIFACMKQLESLEFDAVYCDVPGNKYPSLESALTGFSHEICLQLAESDEGLDDVDVENLRENLSILELKNLTSLRLTDFYCIESNLLTRVSGIFAFQLMPQLRVTVEFWDWRNEQDKKTDLEAMAPYSSTQSSNK